MSEDCSGSSNSHTGTTVITRKRSPSRSRTTATRTTTTTGRRRYCGAEGWTGTRQDNTSSSSISQASDSAYGTMDEDDEDTSDNNNQQWRLLMHKQLDSVNVHRRRRGSSSRRGAARSRSVGDVAWASTTSSDDEASTTSLAFSHLRRGTVHAVDFDCDVADASFEESSSASLDSSVQSSMRSSPEPSEYEFDMLRSSPFTSIKPRRRRSSAHRSLDLVAIESTLARRHTLPTRRSRIRTASISVSIVSPSKSESAQSPASPPSHPTSVVSRLPILTTSAACLTAAVSAISHLSSTPFVMHASPVHLLHPRGSALSEYANAALTPFLAESSTSALALTAINLTVVKTLEDSLWPRQSVGRKVAGLAGVWTATVALRVLLSWVFGRVLGWAHPGWFATSAIHELGAGLAPILLAMSVLQATLDSAESSSLLQLAILAANLCTPVDQGGTGPWMALSAVAIGCVLSGVVALSNIASSLVWPSVSSSTRKQCTSYFSPIALTAVVLLPILATFAPSSPSPPSSAFTATSLPPSALDSAFSSLHPSHPHLLTILLMTAPRPGQPDFLFQTVESWLGALPDPHESASPHNLTTADRVRMIVYTHFETHDVFDAARDYFSNSSPSSAAAAKAMHYIEWHRDPRSANRLDQRLHVARGLDYAANSGGSSAYVMLAEDDFPLCPDREAAQRRGKQKWTETWRDFERALVATNEAMPDLISPSSIDESTEEDLAGHCGLFVATGGSGLAMRGFISSKMPALLLGSNDPTGADRDRRAAMGHFSVKHEDEGADTPDLVIQDCLRGRLDECRVCAPGAQPGRTWPLGSTRRPGSRGDRVGKSGLAGSERLMQHHLGYNASTLPGRKYGVEEWACGWRQPFNGEPDVLTV